MDSEATCMPTTMSRLQDVRQRGPKSSTPRQILCTEKSESLVITAGSVEELNSRKATISSLASSITGHWHRIRVFHGALYPRYRHHSKCWHALISISNRPSPLARPRHLDGEIWKVSGRRRGTTAPIDHGLREFVAGAIDISTVARRASASSDSAKGTALALFRSCGAAPFICSISIAPPPPPPPPPPHRMWWDGMGWMGWVHGRAGMGWSWEWMVGDWGQGMMEWRWSMGT